MRDLETVLCHHHSRSQSRYPRFILCPDCRVEAPHEAVVVEAVVNYFLKPEFRELIIQTEHSIQMGADNRRADVVLLDTAENFVAIAECKRQGIVSSGHEQLQSYLCATDTQFGVFANSTDSDDWKFYENLGQNRFRHVTKERFETEIGVGHPIERISKAENRLKNVRTSRARFARRRNKAKRVSQRNS